MPTYVGWKSNIQKAKTPQKNQFERSLFYYRPEIAILSGRRIHLQQTKGLPFSHPKPYANQKWASFPNTLMKTDSINLI